MNLKGLIDDLLLFVSNQVGVAFPRLAAGLLGLLLLVIVLVGRWERRLKAAPALVVGLAGLLLVAMALDTRVLHALVETSFLTRIRLLLGLLSAFVLAVTFESIRISRLRERYALLWLGTAAMVLLAALFPQAIRFLTAVLGVQYVTAVVAVVFTFLLLVSFHFSLALSGLEEDRARIAQRCALIELRVAELEKRSGLVAPQTAPAVAPESCPPPMVVPVSVVAAQRMRGAAAAAWALIGLSTVAVLVTGWRSPQAMVGDEVTHYYMLKEQVRVWPTPNFFAAIPNGWNDAPEIRRYPHPNGWHYLGALVDRVSGGSFRAVQLFHVMFWLQLLVMAYRWACYRGGLESRAAFLYVLALASVPMNLLFSVAFYQDVPMAAQAVTAFYLLDRRRYLFATLFLAFAFWMKVTGIIFILPFAVLALLQVMQDVRERRSLRGAALVRLTAMAVLMAGAIVTNAYTLRHYAQSSYYPADALLHVAKQFRTLACAPSVTASARAAEKPAETPAARAVTPYEAVVIANHPGDLRKPENFVLYGGVLMWLLMGAGFLGLLRPRGPAVPAAASRRRAWPLAVGAFYLAVTGWYLQTAPDARFFLPALPFVLLPLCEWTMRLPRAKWILILATVMGLFQGAQVLVKAESLREISPGLREVIRFLDRNPPLPRRVFMYPEGNYRLFPVPHDWYLSYRLREMWTSDNELRLTILRQHEVGAIVVKKHLIAPVDRDMNNLGVYPPSFVADLRADSRFRVLFENEAAVIFEVPQVPVERTGSTEETVVFPDERAPNK
jgi:ABC-type multidrug transport system fused ATPase/permease subunit